MIKRNQIKLLRDALNHLDKTNGYEIIQKKEKLDTTNSYARVIQLFLDSSDAALLSKSLINIGVDKIVSMSQNMYKFCFYVEETLTKKQQNEIGVASSPQDKDLTLL